MVAEHRGKYWVRGAPVRLVTVRMTRDGKIAHLFTDFLNASVNGYRIAYCNLDGWTDTGLSTKKGKWTVAPEMKLCNNCMRAWRLDNRKYREWRGEP